MNTCKVLSIAALTLAGALATGAAQASDRHVEWSVRIATPLPLLPIPLPHVSIVHDRGQPTWREPVYPAWRDRDRDGVPDRYDRHDDRRQGRHGWGDRDRDGVPDRYDRHDNRFDDRHARGPGYPAWRHGPDRDRDGIPDWRDRRDNRRDGR